MQFPQRYSNDSRCILGKVAKCGFWIFPQRIRDSPPPRPEGKRPIRREPGRQPCFALPALHGAEAAVSSTRNSIVPRDNATLHTPRCAAPPGRHHGGTAARGAAGGHAARRAARFGGAAQQRRGGAAADRAALVLLGQVDARRPSSRARPGGHHRRLLHPRLARPVAPRDLLPPQRRAPPGRRAAGAADQLRVAPVAGQASVGLSF